MNSQELSMDTLSKYLDIMDRLWSLNQSMIKRNMEYTIWENAQLKKALSSPVDDNPDDIPF